MEETIQFRLNGTATKLTVDSDRKLLWVLRTDLEHTGTKYGCGEGFCGACTVLVDGVAIRSCQTTVKDIQGKEVTTIEGLEVNGKLHPLQKAFMDHDAFQCGYCTSGMIMTAYSFLKTNPHPSTSDIVSGLDDNLCRCGAHKRILEAVGTAAKEMKGGI
jgi:aerobic-type carbon monoxide dehydrogenase small subunit (CoxS/CutS family)